MQAMQPLYESCMVERSVRQQMILNANKRGGLLK